MSAARRLLALPAGTVVGRYRLGAVHTAWGFYLAYEAEETGTGARVSAVELVPEELAERSETGDLRGKAPAAQAQLAWARERFLDEGRALLEKEPAGVEKVLAIFEAKGTAWRITPPPGARTLRQWLEELGRPPTEAELRRLLAPLLATLGELHAAGLHHLNLRPETILLSPVGRPMLTRVAGAVQAIAQHSHAGRVVTDGYSAPEQYEAGGREGAWTDLYALASVLLRAMTGETPSPASRSGAPSAASRLAGRYSTGFLQAIDCALARNPAARPQTVAAWRAMPGLRSRSVVPLAWAGACLALLLAATGWWWLRPVPLPPVPPDKRPRPDEAKKAQKDDAGKAVEPSKPDEPKPPEKPTPAEDEKEKAAEKKAQEAARQAEERKTAAQQAAREEAAQKAAAEKKARETAQRQAAEKAREAAQKEAAARAEKEAREQAAREQARAEAAARQAAAEKLAAESRAAEQARAATPAPPPAPPHPAPVVEASYISIPVEGAWVPADAPDESPRRIEFSGSHFVLRGQPSVQGGCALANGVVSISPAGARSLQNGTYKMRGLSRITITGTVLEGEWRRLKHAAATPPPP